MEKGRGVISKIIILVVIVLTIIVFHCYRLFTISLPETKGELTLNILESPVHVFRDEYGVPHIFSEKESDLYRASGYVTAQDRLWQMDFNRRVATGKLSEIFGESTLEYDLHVRSWGFYRTAKEITDTLSPESLLVLEAYVEGVNAFIDTHLERLPIEFSVLKYKPEKWKIEDCVVFSRFLAWKLSFSWYVDIVLQKLVDKLGEKKTREIFPDFPKSGPFILSSKFKSFSTEIGEFFKNGLALREFLGMQGAHLGSNSWVVSGEKSTCGKPLLANDPHLELMTPSIWYEMHLSCGELNVAGVTLPGTPGILIGHNEHIAWGLTNGMVDDVDFYVEQINPENPNQYLNGKKWQDFEQIEETILVKDNNPVTMQIQISRNGPIISKSHPLLKNNPAAVSMRWTGYQPSDEFAALLKMQQARNWHDFTRAVSNFKVPSQNFTFASENGDIGYYLGGAIPIRKNATGILPHQGWLDTGQWIGYVPFEKLPHVLNPPEHFIVTANNKIVDNSYPYYITNLWEPASRAARLHQILSEKKKFSIEDFKSMQTDVVSILAQKIMPILLRTVETRMESDSTQDLRTLYNLIKYWDCKESTVSVAASIFNAFFLKLTENTLQDEMGEELYSNYIQLSNIPVRVMTALLENENTQWFDNALTPDGESREDIIVQSLLDAGTLLKNIAGESISSWSWGQIHTLKMLHPLGSRKLLDTVFNLGPFPLGGSSTTINKAEYRFDAPFSAVVGASTRQLVDFCNIDSTYSVITSGQSGQRQDKHYKDQTPLWLEGKYHRVLLDSLEISQTAPEHLLLRPNK